MNLKSNSFFLDIFNKILKINDNEIIIIFDNDNNIWFSLRDIIKVLGYNNVTNAITNIKISSEYKMEYSKILTPNGQGVKKFIKPNRKFINEPGLYELLSISTKPLAKIFMDEYFTKIMPEIRKTGKFMLDNQNKKKLNKINNKLTLVENNNKNLLNNQRNLVYPIGNALYVIIKIINNKNYFKIGYTKDLNKRLKVYNTSFPYKIFYNYYILVNDPDINRCIKNIMKNEEFIKNKEYYKTTLNKVLKFIVLCDKSLNKICCGYCLKCYNFKKIKLHKCEYL